ncbi:MAG: hypothetical protein CO093_07310 [Alphaproteobacteria bacterium CG_4_9_14_3_um_filter_47_13]|nr:MAG: hypothetical protein CO093_07310 [Alphaproteobacteria bacterium CG_4_9_14_3_um_filter_47_13]
MVIKGRPRCNGVQLAMYLLDAERNEQVDILAINHPDRDNLHQALADMQDMTDTGQRGTKGLYHAQISPAIGYEMNEDQWRDCVKVLGQELGLEAQPHALVLHQKEGRIHAHVVWQRTDPDSLTLISDSNNYAAHERAARQLENMFGHERIEGPHTGKTKDDKSYSAAELEQGERAALSPAERKAQLTDLWKRSDNGQAFTAALNENGYVLARGDKRGMVIVDEHGEVHSLARQINGVKTKEIEARLDHIDKEKLPNVTDALAMQMDAREEKFVQLDPDKEQQQQKTQDKTAPNSTKGPGLKRGDENPDQKEKRLRALTRNVIGLINSKIEQVTDNSRLYQSAKAVVQDAKQKVTGFMRSIGLAAPERTAQPQQMQQQESVQKITAPELQRDDLPDPEPQKAKDHDRQNEPFDLEALERQNREKQRENTSQKKEQGFDLEALEKQNRAKQKIDDQNRKHERGGRATDSNERE